MTAQILDTWQINHRVNTMLLGAITDAGLRASLSTRGGRDVARQFAHLHNVRLGWIEVTAKDLSKGLTKFDAKLSPSRQALTRHMAASTEAIGEMLARGVEKGGTLKGFKRGVVAALGYFLAHEGHHRGSILLTLKQSGHKIPPEVQYGIWDWNRI